MSPSGARSPGPPAPLAVIGIGCRYPGSRGPQELWRSLCSGREQLAPTPPYRARLRSQGDPRERRPGVARRGSLGEVGSFDWRAFRMSPRECTYTDPQHRVLLEVAWEALEDAGLPLERVAATRTAVFVGIMWPDYAKLLAESAEEIAGYATAGVGFALAANRISHCFDLRGPSVALDVQCASSLTAVHLAARTIWSGEADLALAGGVNLILTPDSDYMMSRAGILSRAGRCATFDADADGFVRSEGAGLVVLKPLAAAHADGDRILALLRGSAVNHDGRTVPLTAPSKDSQVELIASACATAGVDPAALDYVELHGTGTQRGDPLEAQALGEAVGSRRHPARPCLVGAVKTNIGHCEAAAGVGSVIKTVLCLHHRAIPPTINHRRTNPQIDERALGIRLVTKLTPWPRHGGERLAGVTGLSLGGGNAHVILAGACRPARPRRPPARTTETPLLLAISARTPQALRKLARAYAAFLRTSAAREQIADVCYTAALRRSHHEHRTVAVADTPEGLADRLAAFAELEPRISRRLPGVQARPSRVVFVLPNEREIDLQAWSRLLAGDPSLSDCYRQVRARLRRAGLALPSPYAPEGGPSFAFALQSALIEHWRRSNVVAETIVAEGVGAVAAAHAVGRLAPRECAAALGRAARADRRGAGPRSLDVSSRLCAYAADGQQVCDREPSSMLPELVGEEPAVIVILPGGADLLGRLSGTLAQAHGDARLVGVSGREPLWRVACELYTAGCPLDWGSLFPSRGAVVTLPLYEWDRERLWVESREPGAPRGAGQGPTGIGPKRAAVVRRSTRAHPGARFASAWRRLVEGVRSDGFP